MILPIILLISNLSLAIWSMIKLLKRADEKEKEREERRKRNQDTYDLDRQLTDDEILALIQQEKFNDWSLKK